MGSGNSGGRQEQQQLLLLLVALSAGVSIVQQSGASVAGLVPGVKQTPGSVSII